jgi:hypothetical protein
MCYGDIDYGTDGYYRQHMEAAAREAEQASEVAYPERFIRVGTVSGLVAHLVAPGARLTLCGYRAGYGARVPPVLCYFCDKRHARIQKARAMAKARVRT